MICLYHADMDGICSAAIVYRALGDGTYISINHKDKVPFEKISKDEQVVIVDFSLQTKEEWTTLLEITSNIIWIDHHKSAIMKWKHLNLQGIQVSEIKGMRYAGCELTWKYFFSHKKEVPMAVQYLGDYDTWSDKFGEISKLFHAGILVQDTNPEHFFMQELLFYHKNAKIINKIIGDGHICKKLNDNQNREMIKDWSYVVEFEGYNGIACNKGLTNSMLFDSAEGDFDLMLPHCWDGEQWTVSIYSKKDIDCSKIAEKFGGGGHKGAAGFQCKELPWVVKKN